MALKYLDAMASDFSPLTIGLFKKSLDVLLPRFYDGFHLNENGFDIPRAMEKYCVVFVPNHKSHADYIVFYYLLYQKYRTRLNIAGGINLDIPLIGGLFRKSGCFFIRRSFTGNALYKLTLESYLCHLLESGDGAVKFFFEGGRTRTGKLLPPKLGFFRLLMDAHGGLRQKGGKPLLFVPVSIVYDRLAEHASLIRELEGEKKRSESIGQLLGLSDLLSRRLGGIRIVLGEPVECKPDCDARDVASRCFREVAANVEVTPVSLLALVLLDAPPRGGLGREELLGNCRTIIHYCRDFSIPCSLGLEEDLGRALSAMVRDGMVRRRADGRYSVGGGQGARLAYFKNTILHHFLVAWAVCAGQDEESLVERHRSLGFEFHLPPVGEFLRRAGEVAVYRAGHPGRVESFARSCRFIEEGRYRCALAIGDLSKECPGGFGYGAYVRRCGGFSSMAKSSMKYFSQCGIVVNRGGCYLVDSSEKLDRLIGIYEKSLVDQFGGH